MNNRSKALTHGLAAVGIWSTVASAFKLSLRHLDPLQLLLVAAAFSLLALGIILLVQGKLREAFRVRGKALRLSALAGIINPFLYYIILFKSYALLPAQEAQPLNYTWAITLSLLSVPLLGQKLCGRDLVAILVSYFGVLVISTHGDLLGLHFSDPLGVALALGSTILWALYWILNTRSTLDPVVGLFLNFLFALPPIAIATCIFSELPAPSLPALLGGGYVGVFEMGVTFALWLSAMKHAALPDGGGTARVANLIFLSPFLSLVFIHFIAGETIIPATIIGLAFIVAGNVIMQYKGSKQ
ncbi:DMT family transporter [Pseudodesulfovibrio sp.]|uniref:DMT family transporter n=1 Tax=unclassified Pseudodesulfovibrio TaxID=2661612 RepID=UPI003B00EFA4